MTYESKQACERIVALCEKSDNLTTRQCRIYDCALEGLGMVKGQRDGIVQPWRQKIIQARRDRQKARKDAEEMAAHGLELVA